MSLLRALAVPGPFQPDPVCITCTPPERDPETVAFTDHWKIVLHPSQCGLGNVLLATRCHVPRMADLTDAEAQEFHAVLRVLEPALERAFSAKLINLAYQRNWAYRAHDPEPPFLDGQPNPHVHWHVTPRYAQPVEFGGLTFTDPTYGEPFDWRPFPVTAPVRRAILERLQRVLRVEFT